jgi:pseudaminic acid synthase
MSSIVIGKRQVGSGMPAFIVGELSGNHRGDFEIARKSVLSMKECGLDAVKIQTLKPGNITLDSEREDFVVGGGTIWDGARFHDLYKEIYTPWEWTVPLMELAQSLDMEFFSSPFGHDEVEFLDQCGISAFKIASFEITDIPLIEHAASKGKPIIISTGIAGYDDIELAVNACRRMGNDQIIILKCTSSYPTPPEEANLSLIPRIRKDFDVEVGLSDHTLDILAPVAATIYGACFIEKHFILDKSLGGPDASFSLEPQDWKNLVDSVRNAEKMIGSDAYVITDKMRASRDHARSLYIAEDVKQGDVVTELNVKSVRPGFGLHPKYWAQVKGMKFRGEHQKGERLGLEMLE